MRTLLIFGSTILAFLSVSCSESSRSTTPDANVDVAIDNSFDTAAEVGPGVLQEFDCPAPCRIRWRELRSYDMAIDHHSTYTLERADGWYLYVIGGITASSDGQSALEVNRRVSAAKILSDGSLGPFEHANLPTSIAVAFHYAFQYQSDTVQSLGFGGGIIWDEDELPSEGAAFAQSVVLQLPAGTPGSGLTARQVGQYQSRLSAVTLHGAVWRLPLSADLVVFGGSSGRTLSNQALRLTTSEAAQASTEMPSQRSHHALVVDGDDALLLGGFSGDVTNPTSNDEVWRVHREGNNLRYETVGTLPDAPWTASAFLFQGFVYVVGGGHGGGHHGDAEFLDLVRRAPIASDGSVGTFELVSHLPVARSHVHQTPLAGNRIYSVGGRTTRGTGLASSNRIFVGEIVDPGVVTDAGVRDAFVGSADANLAE